MRAARRPADELVGPWDTRPQSVGELRQNQLLHTYGVGAMVDLPNLSVIVLGLEDWDRSHAQLIREERLLRAIRDRLGPQVDSLRLPPYEPETTNPFGERTGVGVPVAVFPSWLRCTDCHLLAPAERGFFELKTNPYAPGDARYLHSCRGTGGGRPVAVPARFVLACKHGHLDDFPWLFFVHGGADPGANHTLTMIERGATGDVSDVRLHCSCGQDVSMARAFGLSAPRWLPGCRGRHPHLRTFTTCGLPTKTLILGATNSWFGMSLSVITMPLGRTPVAHLVARFWDILLPLANLPAAVAKDILPTQTCWPELEPYGLDTVWNAITYRAQSGGGGQREAPDLDLRSPEWRELSSGRDVDVLDLTTRQENVPPSVEHWLRQVTLVPRLRRVAALYGFTRIDAPEWEVVRTDDDRRAELAEDSPTWVPCAETRGEGVFLRFDEESLRNWERREAVAARVDNLLLPGHRRWRRNRRLDPADFPGARYVLLHSFAHILIREFALESGYSAAGIAERIYAQDGMAGILLYTAAPDSEGTLGGLVSLGRSERLSTLIKRALASARRCSTDPLCAEHDPTEHGRLFGAGCHACLFAAETSCERGNHYLDRALLVETLAGDDCHFF